MIKTRKQTMTTITASRISPLVTARFVGHSRFSSSGFTPKLMGYL
jgi:hypothetical protein